MSEAQLSFYLARPDILLRLEALLALFVGCVAYQHLYPGQWGFFALLLLAPDLSLLAYLRSRGRVAAAIYNSVHNYALPLALGFAAWHWSSPLAGKLMLIWMAHISFDRVLGFGLKFPGDFKFIHLQGCASLPAAALKTGPEYS
jgi:hypothetical protein